MTWQALQPQDKVRIIAPGAQSKASWEDLKKCCQFLEKLNLTPIYSTNIFAPIQSFYPFANTDDARYRDFIDAMQSDVAAIWCFRGGYGSDRVLARLVHSVTPTPTQKIFVGYSDITHLHSYLNQHWHWHTLHAPVLKQLGLNQIDTDDVNLLKDILFGKIQSVKLNLIPLNDVAKHIAEIPTSVTGGNLTTIQSAFGTTWQIPFAHRTVLLEDIGEAPYRIARMLQQFILGNFLNHTHAIILGDFISSDPGMELSLQEFASQCSIPVLRYEGIGHGKKNYPIPFGTPARLKLGETPHLTIKTGIGMT